MIKTILWLSRHAMTEEQLQDLKEKTLHYYVIASEVEVVNLNVAFPAYSGNAVNDITALIRKHQLLDKNYSVQGCVAGVFPAHIVAEIVRHTCTRKAQDFELSVPILVPVSIPAPAKEGETWGGGFVHSHWEFL